MILINEKQFIDKQYIFVDFFDTVMFRKVHSHQMPKLWDDALSKKLGLKKGKLLSARKDAIRHMARNECAISYTNLCNEIYSIVKSQLGAMTKEEFAELSKEIDIYIEFGVQYLNCEIVDFLRKQKQQQKRIVLVSDFYLPRDAYYIFLKKYNMEDFFDQIYCSSDIGKTKYDGRLYKYVLDDLGISAHDVIMMGDSRLSDVDSANKNGIDAIRYFPISHKILTNFSKKFNHNCSKSAYKNIKKEARKTCIFGAYAFPLVYVTIQLHNYFLFNEQNANFLSRGGFFLKKVFDAYEEISVPQKEIVYSTYLLNSRKVNEKAKSNAEDRELLLEYLNKYKRNGKLCFIDEGWYGHGQILFTETLGLETKGYYLGLMENFFVDKCVRKGILFGKDLNNNPSPFYGVFRTNCTLWEQILTAPHGSVQSYYRDKNGAIKAVLEENIKEKTLYENYTEHIQEQLLDFVKAIYACECTFDEFEIAKIFLKELLFAKKAKRNVLLQYSNNYYNNIVDNSEKEFGKIASIKIDILDMILNPENYLRYFCKLKEKFNSGLAYALYCPIGAILYCYIYAHLVVKKMRYTNDKNLKKDVDISKM